MTGTIYVSNFLRGLVSQPALITPSLVFLHRSEDCTFSSELGFSGSCSQHRWCESPVLLMHAHRAGSILHKMCTLCQPRSAGCSSSQGLISEFAERWRCAERKETQHTPAGGEWRLIKSMGFLWSFFFSLFSEQHRKSHCLHRLRMWPRCHQMMINVFKCENFILDCCSLESWNYLSRNVFVLSSQRGSQPPTNTRTQRTKKGNCRMWGYF